MAALPFGSHQPFVDYVTAVDDELEKRFGITSHQGQLDAIAASQEAGDTPQQCVDFLTATYRP